MTTVVIRSAATTYKTAVECTAQDLNLEPSDFKSVGAPRRASHFIGGDRAKTATITPEDRTNTHTKRHLNGTLLGRVAARDRDLRIKRLYPPVVRARPRGTNTPLIATHQRLRPGLGCRGASVNPVASPDIPHDTKTFPVERAVAP